MARKRKAPVQEAAFLFEESVNILGEVLIPMLLIPVGMLLVAVSGGERTGLLLIGVLLSFLSLAYAAFILRGHVRVHHHAKFLPGPPKEYVLFMVLVFLLLAIALALGGMASAFQGFVATLAALVLLLVIHASTRSAAA